MDHIDAARNAFVGFASAAVVLVEDASVLSASVQGYALPNEENWDTAVTLADLGFDTKAPCSDYREADWEQDHAWAGRVSSSFVGSTGLNSLGLFLHGLGNPLADQVPFQGCRLRHERTGKIRVACVLASDWVWQVHPATCCPVLSSSGQSLANSKWCLFE